MRLKRFPRLIFWGAISMLPLFQNVKGQPLVPSIIPPSPEASNLGRYADIPVSLYTGLPSIQIPLHEVRERSLSLPINLSYHAAGNKVETIASWVGLGWALNAGGVITRSIKGKADEFGGSGFLSLAENYASLNEFNCCSDAEKANNYNDILNGCLDPEPDDFFFNFAGLSGKFSFDWNGNIITSSEKQLNITFNGVPGQLTYFQSWSITDDSGVRYDFEEVEGSDIVEGFELFPCDLNNAPVSSWYLTKITSPNGESHISFEYEPYTMEYRILASEVKRHRHLISPASAEGTFLTQVLHGKRLSKITTSSGQTTIEFLPGLARTNLGSDVFALGEVVVRNPGKIIRRFVFDHNGETGRLTLKSIREMSADGSVVKPPYEFEYDETSLPDQLSKSRDHWGFYNDNTLPTLIPAYGECLNTPIRFTGADREFDAVRTKAGIIKRITYPTGGHTAFEFEPHEFSFIGSEEVIEHTVGEIRTESISAAGLDGTRSAVTTKPFIVFAPQSVPVSFSINIQRHEFNDGDFSGGGRFIPTISLISLDNPDNPTVFVKIESGTFNFCLESGSYLLKASGGFQSTIDGQTFKDLAEVTATWTNEFNQRISASEPAGGLRIKRMTDHDGIDPRNDIIRVFDYNMARPEGGVRSSGVLVSKPQYEYRSQQFEDNNIIEILVRQSFNRAILGSTSGSHIGYRQVTTLLGENGELGKTISRFTSPFEFPDLVENSFPFPPPTSNDHKRGLLLEENDFENSGQFTEVRRLENQYDFFTRAVDALKVGFAVTGTPPIGTGGSINLFAPAEYQVNLGFSLLKTTSETLLNENRSYTSVSNFQYDPDTHLLTASQSIDSEGVPVTTHFRYPANIDRDDQVVVIGEMLDRNMVNIVMESITTRNDRVTGGEKTNYFLQDGLILRRETFSLELDRSQFVTMADLESSNFYSSFPDLIFEDYDEFGNLLQVNRSQAPAVAFLWGYDGTLPIARISNAEFTEVINAFDRLPFSLEDIKAEADQASLIASLNALADELPNAQVEHFSYDPLNGMTSATDANGISTFFSYDPLGRLRSIAEHDSRVRNVFEYQFLAK